MGVELGRQSTVVGIVIVSFYQFGLKSCKVYIFVTVVYRILPHDILSCRSVELMYSKNPSVKTYTFSNLP